uniref:B box-type domain-containing protein n=1 Tax=Syphacia muris TaxID=451379 RepID=A0A0N5AF22_9BILA
MEDRQSDVPSTSNLLLRCENTSVSSSMPTSFSSASQLFLEPGVSGLPSSENVIQAKCPSCNKEYPSYSFVELPCRHRFCNRCATACDRNQLCSLCMKDFSIYSLSNRLPVFQLFPETSSSVSSLSVDMSSSIWKPLTPRSIPRTEFRPPTLFCGSPSSVVPSSKQQQLSTSTSDNGSYGGRQMLSAVSKITSSNTVYSIFTMASKEDLNWNPVSETDISSNFDFALPKCTVCDERNSFGTVRCIQCGDTLCNECVVAHNRVRMTRDHNLVSLESLYPGMGVPIQSPLKNDNVRREEPGNEICESHDLMVICTCVSCGGANLCKLCIYSHAKHQIVPFGDLRSSFNSLLSSTKHDQKDVEDALVTVRRMADRVEASVQAVGRELRSVAHLLISAIEDRKRILMQKVDTIRQSKLGTLQVQSERISTRLASINEALQNAQSLSLSDDVNDSQIRSAFEALLSVLREPRLILVPSETDQIRFIQPDAAFVNKVRNMGNVDSGPCARTSHIIGEGYKRAIRDRTSTIIVQLRDACGDICASTSDVNISAVCLNPNDQEVQTHIVDREPGVYAISYYPIDEGDHLLDVRLRGVSISGCPAVVRVRKGRNYAAIARNGPLFSFGGEGSEDGKLCRPWGICCDLKGRIIVADRSNNRIQANIISFIFDKDGAFLMKFGSPGSRPGQFDRPAGIAVNSLNEIVVADKDNHRIQVFNESGTFLLKFGERGRSPGTFNYPWGVAVNAYNEIAVSDTRNRRVQIFSAQGQYLRKFGFDSAVCYKNLDSPRGVCYMHDGQLLISDFNNHRLVLTSPRSSNEFKCYGSEGQAEGFFCRPQGIAMDNEGHILVCDSRNNRVQVLNADDFRCIASFGGSASPKSSSPQQTGITSKGSAPVDNYFGVNMTNKLPSSSADTAIPMLDRPTDVCVSPDGLIYVVEFGSNYIRVY